MFIIKSCELPPKRGSFQERLLKLPLQLSLPALCDHAPVRVRVDATTAVEVAADVPCGSACDYLYWMTESLERFPFFCPDQR